MNATNQRRKKVLQITAGVAASVGGGLAASQAQGGIVHEDFNATVNAANPSVSFDFDHDGQTDLTIEYGATTGLTLNDGAAKLSYLAASNADPAALPFGETIGGTPPTGDSYSELGLIMDTSTPINGNFTSSSELAYLGLNLGLSSDPNANHYAWIGFLVTDDSSAANLTGVINGFGYESTPDMAISAGAVPEPTSLGLLALGAIGLRGYRRRSAKI